MGRRTSPLHLFSRTGEESVLEWNTGTKADTRLTTALKQHSLRRAKAQIGQSRREARRHRDAQHPCSDVGQHGAGHLFGNLLCAVAGLLDGEAPLGSLTGLAEQYLASPLGSTAGPRLMEQRADQPLEDNALGEAAPASPKART